MALIEEILEELKEKEFISILDCEHVKHEFESLIVKYKLKEEKIKDDCFLFGFHDGYHSDSGIPNEIQKINNYNNNIIL